MGTTLTLIVLGGILLFLSGLLIGLLYERRQISSLYNGNVLVTSQVEQLINNCTSEDKNLETARIKNGIRLLSEGFSVSEATSIISKENETVLPNM